MSNPTIRFDENFSFPEVEIAQDITNSFEINGDDFSLLTNQKKLNSPTRSSPVQSQSINMSEVKGDDIEFVNLEDVGTTYDVKPTPTSSDTIRIVRDNIPSPARPIMAPAPQPAVSSIPTSSNPLSGVKSWFSGGATAAEATTEAASNGGIAGGFRNWFGGGSNSSAAPDPVVPSRMSEFLTPEQEFIKKTEALTMLERMDKRGIVGNKMTMANTLEEIQAEVERRKDSKALEASLRFQRSMMTTVTNGLEFLNNRFDPLGVKLDGWSEQVNENIEDYDEIFEELYDKYKDKTKVAPEVRLVMSLGLSAAMCHVTNTMFKSNMPGMDDILRNNPDLARQFAQAAATQAVGPGFGNFVGMGMGDRNNSRRPSVQQTPPPRPQPSNGGGFGDMFGSMFGGGGGSNGPPSPPVQTARREMRGPSGVDDILRTLNQAGEQMPNRAVPPPASPQFDAEEVQSIRSGYTTETARMAGRSRRRTNTAQPVGSTLTLNV